MAAAVRTQAMRVLDAKGVPYRVTTYDVSGAFHSGEDAAALAGVTADAVHKTLVVVREGSPRLKPLLVMVPSDAQIDLKLLARAVGEKRLRMATQREAEQLTGMRVGGISALALQRATAFDVMIDERARTLDHIHISAGVRGTEIELAVVHLMAVTGARFVRGTA